jgi:hypothetical protein
MIAVLAIFAPSRDYHMQSSEGERRNCDEEYDCQSDERFAGNPVEWERADDKCDNRVNKKRGNDCLRMFGAIDERVLKGLLRRDKGETDL